MELAQLLASQRDAIIAEATNALAGARLDHYLSSGPEQNRERMRRLFELTHEAIAKQTLVPIAEYERQVARERFDGGFPIYEVQTAINVLEEVIWRHITIGMQPEDYPRAFGLASTVLGTAKEVLAVEYVSLASREHVPSLDLSALFKGT